MSPSDGVISIVLAGDAAVAVGAAAAAASAAAAKRPGERLDFHVFDCGMTAEDARRFRTMVAAGGDSLTWHRIEGEKASLLFGLYSHSNRPYPPAAYARLLVGDILPSSTRRAIYLDTDVVVRGDLRALWDIDMEGCAALAIADLPRDEGRMARLAATLTERDRRRFDVDETAVYFQSGVMVLDVDAFRDGVARDVLATLRDYPRLHFPDQDALNIVLSRRRRLIDPRWNQMTSIYWTDDWRETPYDEATFGALRETPFVIHFSGRPKPWEAGCDHPLKAQFDAALARTPWAGAAPGPLAKARRRAGAAVRKLRKLLARALAR
ncbi:glycosyltransferase family 8 protein [Rubrimonas cliftonensis]|uniref:Lipopolysaccharide biosynthesis protein, LPS:glycosyltransferase n=1 Tax=Rubrimonas cliftonensis TaxID=89524 RepID=A0A1H4CVT5_9RHOB|nr:glycosyltransferase family 8 protein [Rubrimonas cliftonensis]SEA64515.1 Lipopolysaccharide biosynthesis protein, LPS:glycosyltransferase [Rubrimonas cliftonensis]